MRIDLNEREFEEFVKCAIFTKKVFEIFGVQEDLNARNVDIEFLVNVTKINFDLIKCLRSIDDDNK